jgi:excisionase family DNA binding protein
MGMSEGVERSGTMQLTPEILTTEEVAELLRVCKRTVERLPLRYLKVGRLRRYRRVDVVEYLEARAV